MISRPRRAPERNPEGSGERPPSGQWVLTLVVLLLVVTDLTGVAAGASHHISGSESSVSSGASPVALEMRSQAWTSSLPNLEPTKQIPLLSVAGNREHIQLAKQAEGKTDGENRTKNRNEKQAEEESNDSEKKSGNGENEHNGEDAAQSEDGEEKSGNGENETNGKEQGSDEKNGEKNTHGKKAGEGESRSAEKNGENKEGDNSGKEAQDADGRNSTEDEPSKESSTNDEESTASVTANKVSQSSEEAEKTDEERKKAFEKKTEAETKRSEAATARSAAQNADDNASDVTVEKALKKTEEAEEKAADAQAHETAAENHTEEAKRLEKAARKAEKEEDYSLAKDLWKDAKEAWEDAKDEWKDAKHDWEDAEKKWEEAVKEQQKAIKAAAKEREDAFEKKNESDAEKRAASAFKGVAEDTRDLVDRAEGKKVEKKKTEAIEKVEKAREKERKATVHKAEAERLSQKARDAEAAGDWKKAKELWKDVEKEWKEAKEDWRHAKKEWEKARKKWVKAFEEWQKAIRKDTKHPPRVVPQPTTYLDGPPPAGPGQRMLIAVTATDEESGVERITADATAINDSGSIVLTKVAGIDRWTATITVDRGTGTFPLPIDAADFGGNHNTTQSVEARVDSTSPSVVPQMTDYPGMRTSAIPGQSVVIAANVTDADAAIENVTVDASAVNDSAGASAIALSRVAETDRFEARLGIDTTTPDTYSLPITARDTATNVNDTESVTVTVSTDGSGGTGDKIVFVRPLETVYPSGQTAATHGQPVTVSVNATSSEAPITSVTVNASAVNASSQPLSMLNDGGATWRTSLTIDHGSGAIDLPVTATDDNNNHNSTEAVEVRVDATAPSVFPSATDYQTGHPPAAVGNTVTISANVTDDFSGVANVTVDASEINTSTSNTSIPLRPASGNRWEAEIVIDRADPGAVELPITATDNASNVNDTEAVTVVVAPVATPVVVPKETRYPPGQRVAGLNQQVVIAVDIFVHGMPLRNVTVDASAVNASDEPIDLANVDGNRWEATITIDHGDGVKHLPVTATAVNSQSHTAPVEVRVDTTPPSVIPLETDYTDSQSSAITGQTVTVAANVTDNFAGVSTVTVNASAINTSDDNESIALTKVSGTDRYEAAVGIDTSSLGTFPLPITATDNATNVNDTESVSVSITTDGSPVESDTVSVVPHETDYPSSQSAAKPGQTVTVAVNATSTAGDITEVVVNASAINTTAGNDTLGLLQVSEKRWEARIDVDRGNDVYALPVTAVDDEDNQNATESVEVIVDSTPPNVLPQNTTYPGGDSSVSVGETVTVAVNASDTLSGLVAVTVNASSINTSDSNTSIPLLPAGGDRWEADVTIDRGSGTVQLPITATDNATNANDTENVTVEIDGDSTETSSPAVFPLDTDYPPGQSASKPGQTVTVGAVVTDPENDVVSVTVNASSINTSTGNTSISLQNVPDTDIWNTTLGVDRGHNTYQLSITATDAAGNTNTSESVEVIVDSVDPAVGPLETSYPSGQPAATHGQSITVSVNATDDFTGVSTVTVNASLVNTSASNAPIELSRSTRETWTASIGIDGGHGMIGLPITATDNASNTNATESVAVRVDPEPPVVVPRNTTYPAGQSIGGLDQEVRFSANVSDPDAGVAKVSVNASAINTSASNTPIPLTHINDDRWAANVTIDRGDGTFNLPITATDNATNVNDTETVTIEVDTTAPSVSNLEATGRKGDTIGVSFNSSEPLTEINVSITSGDSGDTTWLNGSVFTSVGDQYSASASGLQSGDYTVDVVRVVDTAGNPATGPSQEVTLTAPSQAGGGSFATQDDDRDTRVRVLTPEPGEYLLGGSTTSVEWRIDRPKDRRYTISIAVDTGDGYRTVASDLDNTGSYSWRVPDVDATAVNLRVTAQSGSRRVTDTVDRPFAIDATPPTARAAVPETATVGETITVSGAASTDAIGIASYSWRFGDGSTASGSVVTHTYERPGTYVVRLTVGDHVGHEATATSLLDIEATTPETPAETTTPPPSPDSDASPTPTASSPTPSTPGGAIEPAGVNPFAVAIAILLLAGGTLWLVAWRRNWI